MLFPTITFLVNSRMTFILSRFFQELENPNCNEEEMQPKTEELCQEINLAFAEWQLVSSTNPFKMPSLQQKHAP